MKPLATLTVGIAIAAATLSVAAIAHAGGPPGGGSEPSGAPSQCFDRGTQPGNASLSGTSPIFQR